MVAAAGGSVFIIVFLWPAYRYRYESDTSLKLSFLLFLNSKTAFTCFLDITDYDLKPLSKTKKKITVFKNSFAWY